MTNEQAKQILQLYRPGTADAVDPGFAEALALCEHDAELKEWFGNHCALYAALRSKFKKISVPEGFKEQILAERQVHHHTPAWQKVVLAAGAVAAAVAIITQLPQWIGHREPHDFAAYRDYMGSYAARSYSMDMFSEDHDQIRLFLSERKAIADYVLPENLKLNAKAAGCVATTWQGKEVSMICFQSGQPLSPGHKSDLWLFITNRKIAKDAPSATATTPIIAQQNGLITASWTEGSRTYVLAMEGDDKQLLGKFLPQNPVL